MRAKSMSPPSPCPPIRKSAFDRPKKRSGRRAARIRRDGITAHVSYRFNFLAIRGFILKEALEVVHASQTPPESWPSCPRVRRGAGSAELYVEMLSAVAIAQARAGFIEDAAATLAAALQV